MERMDGGGGLSTCRCASAAGRFPVVLMNTLILFLVLSVLSGALTSWAEARGKGWRKKFDWSCLFVLACLCAALDVVCTQDPGRAPGVIAGFLLLSIMILGIRWIVGKRVTRDSDAPGSEA